MITLTWHPPSSPKRHPIVEVIIFEPLGGAAVAQLDTLLGRLLTRRTEQLVINLAECPFLDAAAIDVLLRAHRRAWLTGSLLTLHKPTPRVRRILRLARVDQILGTTAGTTDDQPVSTSTPNAD